MKYLKDISEVVENYDLFFLDVWGVIHDGHSLYSGVIHFFEECRSKGKDIFLVSNSSLKEDELMRLLKNKGLDESLYVGAYTAGMVCDYNLSNKPNEFFKNIGHKYFKIAGQGRAAWMPTSPSYIEVTDIQNADFILLASMFYDKVTDIDEYVEIINIGVKNRLPLVCANADQTVLLGGKAYLCPGAISAIYKERGGLIYDHGKPCVDIYNAAKRVYHSRTNREVSNDKTLMVGDSITTDLKGAENFEIDSMLLLSGIHNDRVTYLDSEQEKLFCIKETCKILNVKRPKYVKEEL